MSSKKTLQSLQAGRGLAALSVVLFHASAVFALPKYWNSHPFGLWLQPANSGVYYFFVLSGFIITYAHAKDVGNPRRLSRYISNRTRRIYPMYWIVTAITLTYLYLAHMVSAVGLNFRFIVGNILLLPFDGDHGTLAVAWTLFHEIIFYIAFASLIVFRRIGVPIMTAWAIGCAARCFLLHGLPPDTGANFANVIFAPINLLFFFGMAAFALVKSEQIPTPSILLFVGVVVYVATWVLEVVRPQNWDGVFPVLAFGIGATLIVLTLCDFEKRGILKIPHTLVMLGDASYSIYLTHFLVISALAKLLSRWRDVVPEYPAFFILIAVSVLVGIVAHVCVERPLQNIGTRGRGQ
jgi:peptidoglycan/LPS O-acetylase OafA/YrhL